jgi:Cys-tRNA(Pro)/Cys-tRNA(Cys) deacylase
MKKLYPTAIHISAEQFEDIIVSGGKVGLQMELPLKGLMKITKAHLVDLVVETK